MKKLTLLVLVLLMVSTFPQFALADAETDNKTTEEKINEMLLDGLNYDDAVYYTEVDDMFREMDKKIKRLISQNQSQ